MTRTLVILMVLLILASIGTSIGAMSLNARAQALARQAATNDTDNANQMLELLARQPALSNRLDHALGEAAAQQWQTSQQDIEAAFAGE